MRKVFRQNKSYSRNSTYSYIKCGFPGCSLHGLVDGIFIYELRYKKPVLYCVTSEGSDRLVHPDKSLGCLHGTFTHPRLSMTEIVKTQTALCAHWKETTRIVLFCF